VIDTPDTVQTPGVSETSTTVRLEDAVAPDWNVWPEVFVPGFAKVIV
jgi:hypothetical protein